MLLATAAAAEPVVVEADRLDVAGGVISADGHVRISYGETVISTDEAELDSGSLRTGRGDVSGPVDGDFVSSWFYPELGLAELRGARLRLPDWSLVAREASLRPGRVYATDAWIWPCDRCPWALHASLALTPARIETSAGTFALGPLRIPVPPLRIPLGRRPRVGLPRLGTGKDGLVAAIPVELPIRAHDLRLAPELRTARGARLVADHRGPTGRMDASAGWDWRDGRPRYGARGSEGASAGPFSAALGGAWGDRGYFEDYGSDYLSRRTAWSEARFLAGFPLVEAYVDHVPRAADLALAGVRGRLVEEIRGVRTDATADLSVTAGGIPAARARWLVDRPTRAGPLVVTPRVVAEGHLAPSGSRATGTGSVDVGLPGWRAAGTAIERLDPVLGASWSLREAAPRVHGGVAWRRTGWSMVEVRATAASSPRGGTEDLRLTWEGDRWLAWARADGPLARLPTRANAGIRLRTSPLVLDASWFHAPKIEQLRGRLGLDGSLRPSVGAIWDPRGVLRSVDAGFSWTFPSGCLGFDVSVRKDVDRPVPDVLIGVRGPGSAPPW